MLFGVSMQECDKCGENKLLNLGQLKKGSHASIVLLQGGKAFQERVSGMGLNPGCLVEVLSNGLAGPVLIATGETRIAIGKKMLEKIMVIEQ
jgi:Fe2+ transport system protein FeoA